MGCEICIRAHDVILSRPDADQLAAGPPASVEELMEAHEPRVTLDRTEYHEAIAEVQGHIREHSAPSKHLAAVLALPLARRQRLTPATSATPLSPHEHLVTVGGSIYKDRLEDLVFENNVKLEFTTQLGAHVSQSVATVRFRSGQVTGIGEITHTLNDANDRLVTSGKYREGVPVKKHRIRVFCGESGDPVHEVQVDMDTGDEAECAIVPLNSLLIGHDWAPPDPDAGPHRLEDEVRYTQWRFYARHRKVDGEGRWVTPGEAYAGVRRAGGPKGIDIHSFNETTRTWHRRYEDKPQKRRAQMQSISATGPWRGTRTKGEFRLRLPGVPEAMADGPRKDAARVRKEQRDRARAREEGYDDPFRISNGPTEARDRSHLRRGAHVDYTEADPGDDDMDLGPEDMECDPEPEADPEAGADPEAEVGPYDKSWNEEPPPDTVHMRPEVEWDGEPKAVPAVDSRGKPTDMQCRWVSEGVYYFCGSDLEFIPELQPYHKALIVENVSRGHRVQVHATERGYEVRGDVFPNKEVRELYEAERVIPDPAATVRAEVTLIRRNTIPSELDTFLNSTWNKQDRTEMHFRAAHEIRAPHLQVACNRMRRECGERHKDSVLCAHGTPPRNCRGILTEGFRLSVARDSAHGATVCVAPNFKMCLEYTEGFDEARGFEARGDSKMLIVSELFYDPDNRDEVDWVHGVVGDPQACKIRELLVPRYIIWLGPERLCDHVDELASKIEEETRAELARAEAEAEAEAEADTVNEADMENEAEEEADAGTKAEGKSKDNTKAVSTDNGKGRGKGGKQSTDGPWTKSQVRQELQKRKDNKERSDRELDIMAQYLTGFSLGQRHRYCQVLSKLKAESVAQLEDEVERICDSGECSSKSDFSYYRAMANERRKVPREVQDLVEPESVTEPAQSASVEDGVDTGPTEERGAAMEIDTTSDTMEVAEPKARVETAKAERSTQKGTATVQDHSRDSIIAQFQQLTDEEADTKLCELRKPCWIYICMRVFWSMVIDPAYPDDNIAYGAVTERSREQFPKSCEKHKGRWNKNVKQTKYLNEEKKYYTVDMMIRKFDSLHAKTTMAFMHHMHPPR